MCRQLPARFNFGETADKLVNVGVDRVCSDNPGSSARKRSAGQGMAVELLLAEAALPLSYRGLRREADLNRRPTITHELRPIEIGVTNRIRTGANAFTGCDAAVPS